MPQVNREGARTHTHTPAVLTPFLAVLTPFPAVLTPFLVHAHLHARSQTHTHTGHLCLRDDEEEALRLTWGRSPSYLANVLQLKNPSVGDPDHA